ncbi:hypothetical protein FZEAL_2745 [Fusarium zealandicum]|uniref:Uncharacterized protein n=1 Tax=Fusarium zealandicum TaxID=1053134 RepID=A0A8H4UQX9_9HYPO|nr:hypothetical protein FZEAL_2745 [Fusarium zealandicum]
MFPTIKIADNGQLYPGQHDFKNASDSSSGMSAAIPLYHKTGTDLDDSISKVIRSLECLREEMGAMAAQHPVSTDELADMLEEARSVANGMMFTVKRYYHDKEEGLRTAREREYAALEEHKGGCFSNRIRRALVTVRYDIESKAAVMMASKDTRTRKLQDALDKVEMHRMLALLAEGASASS